MIYDRGCPHLFVTFSAADIQWPDLHRHMPRIYDVRGDIQALDAAIDVDDIIREANEERNRVRNASNDVNLNPAIVAEYLIRRFDAFYATVLTKVFKIGDYWYRFEWQDRGSGHIHGFLWIIDGPVASVRNDLTRQAMADYWADFITAWNPNQHLEQIGKNPASMPFNLQQNTVRNLTEAINRF